MLVDKDQCLRGAGSSPEIHLYALLLEGEYLAADAAEVGLEGGEEPLHPREDPVAARDLVVQRGNVPALRDIVADRGRLCSLQLLLHLHHNGRHYINQ